MRVGRNNPWEVQAPVAEHMAEGTSNQVDTTMRSRMEAIPHSSLRTAKHMVSQDTVNRRLDHKDTAEEGMVRSQRMALQRRQQPEAIQAMAEAMWQLRLRRLLFRLLLKPVLGNRQVLQMGPFTITTR